MLDFDFENWDFLDPKIVEKFRKISQVSNMLAEEQNNLKKQEFLSFKDKQNVQRNINKFQANLTSLLNSQKDNLMDYFDKQVDTISKRINVPQLSKTFQQSFRHQDNTFRVSNRTTQKAQLRGRRYSEGDLSKYIKEKELKGKILTELNTSNIRGNCNKTTLNASVMRDSVENQSRTIDDARGSVLDLNDLETKREALSSRKMNILKEAGTDSIFTQDLRHCETNAESRFFQSKVNGLEEELEKAQNEIKRLRRFYDQHKPRVFRKAMRRGTVGKNFIKEKRNKPKVVRLREPINEDGYGHEIYREEENRGYVNDEEKIRMAMEIERLQEEVERAEYKDQLVKKAIKELGIVAIQNEEIMGEIMSEKKQIENEMLLTKELNSLLVGNFSQFKGYVEKMFGDVSKKLAAYVQKEEYYMEVAKENEQLRHKCKTLLMKLKEMAELS